MNKNFNITPIKQAKKAYDKATNSFYASEQKLEKAMLKAKCFDCDIFISKYKGKSRETIFHSCSGCISKKGILSIQKEFIDASDEFEYAEKAYARAIFEHLKLTKPILYSRVEKKNVSWEKVFPANFEEVSTTLYTSLVALLESVGGRYVLKD